MMSLGPLAQLLSHMVAKRPAERPDWEEVVDAFNAEFQGGMVLVS